MSAQIIKINEWTKNVINFVEEDLRAELKKTIQQNPSWGWDQLSIQDVFAYSLNQLAPIYGEKDSIPTTVWISAVTDINTDKGGK